jgi:hypothetical protein
MIYVGLDDTDTLDTPGTNQLARHLVKQLADDFDGQLIVRHQLLKHPLVPCTRKNGCASMAFEPFGTMPIAQLIAKIRPIIVGWCPVGSDPGLCVAESVSSEIVGWGRRCQRELVSQRDARQIAAAEGIYLEGLGGTQDGVIGALAAIGLFAKGDDGRIVHLGSEGKDLFEIGGSLTTDEIRACGIAEIQDVHSGREIDGGIVEVGKRLRPNRRGGRAVLLVAQKNGASDWEAIRAT